MCWLSPEWAVARQQREAVGRDDEQYVWTRLMVSEIRDGRLTSACEFEVDDEEAAFAYAEERVRATSSRLAVTNRASESTDAGWRAMQAHDVDALVARYSDRFDYDDRRRLSGGPRDTPAALRLAAARLLEQYPHFEWRRLAVRGERLELDSSRWWDEAGNETTALHVFEIGDDGRITYDGRFDEDDFEGAYRALTRRYCAGEGAAFAEVDTLGAEWMIALNRGDFDRLFGELTHPEMRVVNRSSSAFPDRSAGELRASFEELNAMVASTRSWNSAECWLDSTCGVVRYERQAVGLDGEQFAWTRLFAFDARNGRATGMCEFEPENENEAFAYAEERMWATASRLASTNRASEVAFRIVAALQARDVDGAVAPYSDQVVYDDRRRLAGDSVAGHAEMRAATERILQQYSVFENRTLAVRGERLQLSWTRWSDDAGNEANYLHVFELGDNGRVAYAGRFDEEDFESAYRELERRYYAGEGAAFAEAGGVGTEWVTALNRGDFDRIFDELSLPDLQVENRSLSAVQGRSATDLRAATEQLHAMVASVRVWNSAVCWLSPTWLIARHEREAIGQDSEQYEWTSLLVGESRDGRLASMCVFDIDNEERAFAYAEERMRATDDSD
jgi:ketosteroid isomerase-like protein